MAYKVDDLIYDNANLFRVIDISPVLGKEFTLLIVKSSNIGKIGMTATVSAKAVDKCANLFDINNPPMKTVNKGSAVCHQCGTTLKLGDYCVRDNHDNIYCSEDCLLEYCAQESEILEGDLANSKTINVPMFDITKEELEKVKKEVSEHAVTE